MRGPTLRRGVSRAWAALLAGAVAACGGGTDSTAPPDPAPPEPAQFTITVRFIDSTPISQALRDAFSRAQERWEGVIADSVGSIEITLPAGTCDSVQPALNERIKDLLVLVRVRPLADTVPGETRLGEAGPCLIRRPGNLPILGTMALNSGAITQLAGRGLLDDVIEHEMGHLLGFGTIWDLGNLLEGEGTEDPWFSGSRAQRAFREALPDYADPAVPVEAGGGEGTTLSHWRETVMANELMTGFLDSGENPLSAVTIESLADLGYAVDVGAADPWPTPASAAGAETAVRAPSGTAIAGEPPSHTTLHGPRFSVSSSGGVSPLAGVPSAPLR